MGLVFLLHFINIYLAFWVEDSKLQFHFLKMINQQINVLNLI
jgi:hypothetical protein